MATRELSFASLSARWTTTPPIGSPDLLSRTRQRTFPRRPSVNDACCTRVGTEHLLPPGSRNVNLTEIRDICQCLHVSFRVHQCHTSCQLPRSRRPAVATTVLGMLHF